MSRLDHLLASLCPEGVLYSRLGDVTENLDNRRKPVTKSRRRPGPFPYYGANGIQDYVDDFIFEGTFLLIGEDGSVRAPSGSPVLNWASGKIWVNNHAHVLQSKTDDLDLRFLYFYLQATDISAYVTGGTQPKLNQRNLNSVPVAVPPIEVQREIVRVLDTFARLENELKAELEAELDGRRKQYAHYRDELLSFDESSASWTSLGDAGTIFGGLTGKSKADFSGGNHRFVSYVNVFSNIAVDLVREDFVRVSPDEQQRELQKGDVLFTGSSESAEDVAMSSVVTSEPDGPLHLNSFSIGFRLHEPKALNPEFSKHLFRSNALRRQLVKTAQGVTRFNVSKEKLAAVRIPIPDHRDQLRVARALDGFSSLVDEVAVGLPAEVIARRKQYEYYRDRLMTFREFPT